MEKAGDEGRCLKKKVVKKKKYLQVARSKVE
jgi:hypothetical protein